MGPKSKWSDARPGEASTGHVTEWRQRLLIGAGFASAEAEELARGHGVDLNGLLELVERGCPPHLAARIMAPLDGKPER